MIDKRWHDRITTDRPDLGEVIAGPLGWDDAHDYAQAMTELRPSLLCTVVTNKDRPEECCVTARPLI